MCYCWFPSYLRQPSAFSAAFPMASSLPRGPELACCLASPPPVHAGVVSVILGQADPRGFQYPKGHQPQDTSRSSEARPRECQGKWRCYGLKKPCVMSPRLQRSVTWSTLYQNGSVTSEDIKSHMSPLWFIWATHLTHHSQRGPAYVQG